MHQGQKPVPSLLKFIRRICGGLVRRICGGLIRLSCGGFFHINSGHANSFLSRTLRLNKWGRFEAGFSTILIHLLKNETPCDLGTVKEIDFKQDSDRQTDHSHRIYFLKH
jgi:hypothetical protein